jgi:hypothetical protein
MAADSAVLWQAEARKPVTRLPVCWQAGYSCSRSDTQRQKGHGDPSPWLREMNLGLIAPMVQSRLPALPAVEAASLTVQFYSVEAEP